MNRGEQLAARRRELLLRSELLRQRMGHLGRGVRGSLGGLDRGIGIARSLGTNPLLMTALAGLFAIWRPKGIFKWVARVALMRPLLSRVMGMFTTASRRPRRPQYDDHPYGGQPRDY